MFNQAASRSIEVFYMNNALAPDNAGLLYTRLYSQNGQSHFGSTQETLPFTDPVPGTPFHRCVIQSALNDGQVNVFSNPVDSSKRLRLFNAPARVLLFVLTGKIKVSVYEQAEPAHAHLPLYRKVTDDGVNYLEPYQGAFTAELFYQVESQHFEAGAVILAEDMDGLGHTTQMTEQDLTVVIPLAKSELNTNDN